MANSWRSLCVQEKDSLRTPRIEDKEVIAIATADPFAIWLRTTRRRRGLTQRQLGLPPGTVGDYESGRRHPTTVAQCERIAQALAVDVQAILEVLGATNGVTLPAVYRSIQEGQWAEAYTLIQKIQLQSYRAGNTATLAESDRLMTQIAQKVVASDHSPVLAVDNPVQALDWAALAFRNQQWLSAKTLLEAVHHTLPEHSSHRGRLFNNLAIVAQALGHLEQALAWDLQYIAWAQAQQDAWRSVVGSALALLHQVLIDPAAASIPDYLQTLDQWRRPDTGQVDPLVACWALDARARIALADRDPATAHRYLMAYTQNLEAYPACRGEALRKADIQAHLLQLADYPDQAAALLRTVLHQPCHQYDPVYGRLEVMQTVTRCEQRVGGWRQLLQAYWSLGAKGWITRLWPEWHAVDPAATLDQPPLLLPN